MENDRRGLPPSRFHDAYAHDDAPWDVGHPQPAVVALAERGAFRGRVLDVGCGTGDNTIELAARGVDVTGVDMVPLALAEAKRRAEARGVSVDLRVADALDLGALGETFDVVLDSAVFHVFGDEERRRYVASLANVVREGGKLFVLVFSDRETRYAGPRRITQREIHESFEPGFHVDAIEPARYVDRVREGGAEAWLAELTRAPRR